MAKQKKTIEIPWDLARLLSTEREGVNNPEQYDEMQSVARSLLRLLMEIK